MTLATEAKTMTKAERNAKFRKLWLAAHSAGLQAAAACVPTPMVVQQHANQLDDGSPVVKEWYVPQGVCGFAWVTLHPATSSLAHWLKATVVRSDHHSDWRRAYQGGLQMWVHLGGQSMEIKQAYAGAFAKVFREAGYDCWPGSRMD